METDEKKCPKCAELVKAEAQVCRFCGHDFQGPPSATATPPKEAKKGGLGKTLGLGCLGVLGLIFVVSLFGVSDQGSDTARSPEASAAVAAQATKVTARDLAAAYEANEASAQQAYGKQPLLVTGKIKSIDLDFSDDPFLVLEGTNMFMGPQAQLDEESQKRAGSLGKGQTVELLCADVSEAVGTPMLKDCTIQ